MTDNNQNGESKNIIVENQFLDPPIKPHYRTDESELPDSLQAEISEEEEKRKVTQETKQNDGYKSICRE